MIFDAGYRSELEEPEYIPRRNGRPVSKPYHWRAPGWQERVKRAGLDLSKIALHDAQLEAKHLALKNKQHREWYRRTTG